MTPDRFLEFARIFPEPLLLVTGEGIILSANQAAAQLLECRRSELRDRSLTDCVQEPPEKVESYLQACVRSRQFAIGSLTFNLPRDRQLICRVEGAVIQPKSDHAPAITVFRLQKRSIAMGDFVLLNKKIDELAKEIQNRQQAEAKLRQKNQTLQAILQELKTTQAQLVQTEKMSSLGQLVAGIAHEINNPINFIHGNLTHTKNYLHDLLGLIQLYQTEYPHPTEKIKEYAEAIELEFLIEDTEKILQSMRVGTQRILEIVKSLRNFSRLDESEVKKADIHEGIESTLVILHHRVQANAKSLPIKIVKNYAELPLIDCYPGQLNQVFMNLISNAIDALAEAHEQRSLTEIERNPSQIWISTERRSPDCLVIRIKDNGLGMPDSVRERIFNPFFTTKAIGKGTGLGLSISYQIITQMHQGKLECESSPGCGTEFIIEIPIRQSAIASAPKCHYLLSQLSS
jgi:signal transduction histidine kinase